MNQKSNVNIVVLAAGGSRRMGEQKLLKKLGGKSLVRRAAETALQSRAGRVLVVLGSDEARIRAELADLPLTLVVNEGWQAGQGTSVALGVSALGNCDAAILMASDQPFVTAEHLNLLMDAWEADQTAAACGEASTQARSGIYVSSSGGVQGIPALFSAAMLPELKQLTGDKGARQLFARFGVCPVAQPDEMLFWDTDTADTFRRAEEEWLLRCGVKEPFSLLSNAPITYLDSAATAQIPEDVLSAMNTYERTCRANVHRGIYPLAEASDDAYEAARQEVAAFFGIRPQETIFTHGATEGLNLAVTGWGQKNLRSGDLVLIDTASHHANIVPWQMLQQRVGIRLEFLPLTEEGLIDQDAYRDLLKQKPKAAALTHISNVTGRMNDLPALAAAAHEAGAVVIADCAQSAGHMPLSFPELGVDFAAVSAHKMYGPFGIGLLWAAPHVIHDMQPLLGGGGMIERVTVEGVKFAAPPTCFEAGTPNITGAVGFAAACRFISQIGLDQIEAHGRTLCRLAEEGLSRISGVRLVGGIGGHSSIVSFTVDGAHPHDIAGELAEQGVCVRAGHHCTMPLHQALGIPASIRASFGVYSTRSDVEHLLRSVRAAKEAFQIG